MSAVNQQLLAKKLQISVATVSRCFTSHPGINPLTRAKVFQLAAELGYTHREARAGQPSQKATTKSKARLTLGVLICSDEEEYYRKDYQNPSEQILAGISECAQLNHLKLAVYLVDPKAADLADPSYLKIEKLRRQWNGILLVYPFPAPVLEELSINIPLVSLVEQYAPTAMDCVDVDHNKGISAAVEHLRNHGHRRIGFFTRSYPVEASWSFRRYAAFVEKMARLRLPVSPKDVVNMFPSSEFSNTESIDYAAARTRAGVTAWVCAADHQAYELIRGLKLRGLEVPRHVSVTGFDGIRPPKGCPRLSTIEIPFREIGITGTMRLIQRIRKHFGSPQHVLIDGLLRPGATVGAVPLNDTGPSLDISKRSKDDCNY
jgi:LacI family transcriptional regulator